jgi:hypothetical protein
MSPSLLNILLPTVVALAFSQALVAAQPPPEAADIARLVEQLGSPRFEEREAASRALERIGEPALPALRAAVHSRDAEVRRRAARLVETVIEAASRRIEAQARVARPHLRLLTEACDQYNLNHGSYPPTLAALAQQQPNGQGPLVPAHALKDPWGQPYGYDPAGPRNGCMHADIWVNRPGGKVIGNWPGQR